MDKPHDNEMSLKVQNMYSTTTNDLTCIVFAHYTFLWPADGPQTETCRQPNKTDTKTVVFDVPTPS